MFDFLKDAINEMKGLDSQAINQQEKIKKENEKKSKYIFGKKTKILICILALFYIAFSAGSIYASLKLGMFSFEFVKQIFLDILSVLIISFLIFGKNKGEFAALIMIIVFLLVLIIPLKIS